MDRRNSFLGLMSFTPQVARLPKDALFEVEAIAGLTEAQ